MRLYKLILISRNILKKKYDRAKNLFESNAISDKDLEDAKQSFIMKNAEKNNYINSELQNLIQPPNQYALILWEQLSDHLDQ